MRIFHLSDLHIGLKLYNRDLFDDQAYILEQIIQRAAEYNPDAVVIAGDIYDRAVPSSEAVSLFDRFISELVSVCSTEIMVISGNHDSGTRINSFRNILKNDKIHMIGLPPQKPDEFIEKVTLEDNYGSVNFYLLPFVKPSVIQEIVRDNDDTTPLSYNQAIRKLIERERIDISQRNVIVSHQFYLPLGSNAEEIERMDSEVVTVGNIDSVSADVLAPFDYAALGHIHKPMQIGSPCYRYCGTPLACSVSESEQNKGIILAELKDKGVDISIEVIPLEPKRKIVVLNDTLEEVLKTPSDDYTLVILTDKNDLDVIDMQERLRNAFPNLLEIRRESAKKTDYEIKNYNNQEQVKNDPFEMCKAFLGELDEQETKILSEIINSVKEEYNETY